MNDLFEKYEKYSNYYILPDDGKNFLRNSVKKICEDENLCIQALNIKSKLSDLKSDFNSDAEFKNYSPQFGAFVYTLSIEDMEKLYAEKNIPSDILYATINDLAVWINRHHEWFNEWGFSQYGWIIHHIRGKIFKLGRLQFEMQKTGKYELPPEELHLDIKLGDRYLNVHIPRGGKLDEAACLESFDMAKEFFPKVLNFDFKAFGCFTWLFDPAFEKLLPSDSNILKFQNLFTRFPGSESYGGLDYVFVNITKDNIKDAPTDTYFRKKLVEHILSGGIMQTGGGFRIK